MKIPLIDFCGKKIPRVLIGNSTFLYGTSLNPFKMLWRRVKFYYLPGNVERLLLKAVGEGITGIQLFSHKRFVEAVERVQEEAGVDMQIAASVGILGRGGRSYHSEIDVIARLKPELIAPWLITDFLRRKPLTKAKREEIEGVMAHIRRVGAVPGVATHYPAQVIPKIDGSGLDISFYMVPVNKTGFYMRPNREAVLAAIQATEKPIIAIKPLAWGRIPPREALQYLFDKGIQAVAVGIASEKELIETFSAAEEVLKG